MSQAEQNNIFHFPETCSIGEKIGKALFAENGPLTASDRKTFRNDISEIICSYILDDNHGIVLTPYTDEEHDYTCLTQVDVFLKKTGKATRVAELCHRAMPYPLIVILHDANKIMFSMAEKRFSRDGKEQVVLEQITNTEWCPESNLAEFQNAVDFRKNKKLGFLELYRHYMALLDVLRCAGITGEFKETGLTPEERRILLTELHRLEQHLAEITSRAKQESILSAQMELNMQAARIKQAITKTKERLNHHG